MASRPAAPVSVTPAPLPSRPRMRESRVRVRFSVTTLPSLPRMRESRFSGTIHCLYQYGDPGSTTRTTRVSPPAGSVSTSAAIAFSPGA